MDLKTNLLLVHHKLTDANIDHALIGGLALAFLGIHRATFDIDLLIDEKDKEACKKILANINIKLDFETIEVMHFSGPVFVDVLLARRPLSQEILKKAILSKEQGLKFAAAEDIIGLKIQALTNDPSREFQDKADIQAIMKKNPNLDWDRIKVFADLFGKWEEIKEIRKKLK